MAPKIVFIVPYRSRQHHKFFFCNYMKFILENKDETEYEVYFSHQCDKRSFNRGAMKNIGFLAIKQKYPEDYKNISFVFNDVDTIPFNKIFDYETVPGVVKHFYGFKFALGGIVVMNGGDFERINGFPCYWGWGMEDNILQRRCLRGNIKVDRSVFYTIGSPEILQLFDGVERIVSKNDPRQMDERNNFNGLTTMKQIYYEFSDKSPDVNDNVFVVPDFKMTYINTSHFQTYIPYNENSFHKHDLRGRSTKSLKLNPTTKDVIEAPHKWQNLPPPPPNRKIKNDEERVIDNVNKNDIIQSHNNNQNRTTIANPNLVMNRFSNRRRGHLRYLK